MKWCAIRFLREHTNKKWSQIIIIHSIEITINQNSPFESILLVSLIVSAVIFWRIKELFRRISNDFGMKDGCGFDTSDGIEIDDNRGTTSFWSDFSFCLELGNIFIFYMNKSIRKFNIKKVPLKCASEWRKTAILL